MVGDQKLGGGSRLKDRKSMNLVIQFAGLALQGPRVLLYPRKLPQKVTATQTSCLICQSSPGMWDQELENSSFSCLPHIPVHGGLGSLQERYRSCPDNI